MTPDSTKAAIVTGGAKGIGQGIAQRLLADGCRVLIADVDEPAARELLAALDLGDRLVFAKTDVTDEAQVAAAVAQAVDSFGRLDALVNNAGIGGMGTPLDKLELAQWQRVINTDLTGPMLMAKHAAPHLRATARAARATAGRTSGATSGGAIVNIASTRALMSEPHSEAYAAAKGGLVALTHALAVSLGPDIRVNCICPGWIVTDEYRPAALRKTPALRDPALRKIDHAQHPVGRVGHPPDIAAMTAFLLDSTQSGFITGQHFPVDGGMTKRMIYVE